MITSKSTDWQITKVRDHFIVIHINDLYLFITGITAVDASEVLDIMLSDYPHKYEDYRSHQHQKQLAQAAAAPQPDESGATVSGEESKLGARFEIKQETKPDTKPEPSKIDLEKSRQVCQKSTVFLYYI